MICKQCSTEFEKKNHNQIFCTAICTFNFHNAKRQKVKRLPSQEVCPGCNGKKNYMSGLCKGCWYRARFELNSTRTIAHAIKHRGTSARLSRIIEHGRSALRYEEGRVPACSKCGSDYRLDVVYRRPIDHFCNSTSLREVNNPENLEWRCKLHRN